MVKESQTQTDVFIFVLNFIPENVVETIDFLAQFLYIYILEAVPTETAIMSRNINF